MSFEQGTARAAERIRRERIRPEVNSRYLLDSADAIKKARDLAVRGLPGEFDGRSVPEIEMQEEAERLADKSYDTAQREVDQLERPSDPTGGIQRNNALERSCADSIFEVRQIQGEARVALNTLAERYREAEIALDRFKVDNDLNFPPKEIGSPLSRWWFLVLIFVIEFAFNSFQFSRDLEGGLFEAITISLVLTGLIILFGFSIGYASRYFAYKPLGFARIFPIFWHGPALYCIVFLVLYAAKLRLMHENAVLAGLEVDRNVTNIALEIVGKEVTALFNVLASQSALTVLAAGAVAACYAIYKGYNWIDPYPYYTSHDNKLKSARKKFEDATNTVSYDLDSAREPFDQEAEEQITEADESFNGARDFNDRLKKLELNYAANVNAISIALNTALERFWGENIQLRNDGIRPRHFYKQVDIFFEPLAIDDKFADLERYETASTNTHETVKRLREQLDTQVETFMESIPEMIDDAEKKAQKKLDPEGKRSTSNEWKKPPEDDT